MKITKEVKAGLLVMVAAVAFFVLFNFLKGKNVFVNGRVFYVKYDNVNGLEKSKPVTVNGLRVGRIDDIKIMDKEQPIYFIVKFSIDRDMQFSKNSTAEIYEPGFLSGSEVRLNLDYDGATAENGDTLKASVAPSLTALLSDEIGPTKQKLDSLLLSVTATSDQLQKLMDEENTGNLKNILRRLDGTLQSFGATAQSLNTTSASANRLILSSEKQVSAVMNETNKTLATTQKTLDKYGNLADKFNAIEVDQTLKNFEDASEKLNALLAKVDSDEGTLGALLNDKKLYDNLNETSNKLDALLLDFKENPKRYIQFSVFGKKEKKKEETTENK